MTWIWRHGFGVQQRVVCCILLLDPRRLGGSGVETKGFPRRFCYFCCCAACALLCTRPSERSVAENKGLLHFKQLQCCHEPSLTLPRLCHWMIHTILAAAPRFWHGIWASVPSQPRRFLFWIETVLISFFFTCDRPRPSDHFGNPLCVTQKLRTGYQNLINIPTLGQPPAQTA